MSTPVFEARALSRTFRHGSARVHALDGIDLAVEAGDRVGIVGESGSGKSTLVRLLAALDRPTGGQVLFDGEVVSGLPERRLGHLRASVQPVFQDPRASLDPRMRVAQIITEPLRSRIVRRQFPDPVDHRERLAEVMAAVGLPLDLADRFPHEFSGGQRQRIALARALAPRPQVLIADEPVTALDVSVRAQVINLLSDLVRSQRLTLVLVSHDLMVVRHLCDRVVVLREGRIEEQGDCDRVFSRPESPYTRALWAAVPRIRISP